MHDPLSPTAFESFVLIESKEEGKSQESTQSSTTLTQDTTWVSDKTQENVTYKRAKKLALSQQVTTRLQ